MLQARARPADPAAGRSSRQGGRVTGAKRSILALEVLLLFKLGLVGGGQHAGEEAQRDRQQELHERDEHEEGEGDQPARRTRRSAVEARGGGAERRGAARVACADADPFSKANRRRAGGRRRTSEGGGGVCVSERPCTAIRQPPAPCTLPVRARATESVSPASQPVSEPHRAHSASHRSSAAATPRSRPLPSIAAAARRTHRVMSATTRTSRLCSRLLRSWPSKTRCSSGTAVRTSL